MRVLEIFYIRYYVGKNESITRSVPMAINNIKQAYLDKIDAIPIVSFNCEQKEVARKILESCAESDLDKVYSLITQRVKTGFVFDVAPEVNHNNVCLAVENEKLFIKSEFPSTLDPLEHKLIIGDNYDALKNLCATYIDKNGNGLIDMIYIDPPYNTEKSKEEGNDYKTEVEASKFVYRDKFTRDGWLNMMNERLKLAKQLLTDDGVIFISIDDTEQAYLKVLCDEIFGEDNFISNSILVNNRGGRDYGGIAKQHEYILIYSKTENYELNLIEEIDKQFQYEDEQGGFNLMELRNRNVKFNDKNRPNLCYPFYVNPNNSDKNGLFEISLEEKEGFIKVMPAKSQGMQTVWRWGKEEKARENLNKEIFGKANQNGGYMIVQKYRKTAKMQRSIWDDKEFVSERGTEIVKKLLGGNYFNYPKSVSTIKRILELATNEDSIILDFFAGCGTTGQAVMELNQDDGGNRKFILCTNNENNVALDITRERLYRVINGKGTKGEKIEWEYSKERESLTDNQVRVFEIKHNPLMLEDLATAEKLKQQAAVEFKKLNPNYEPRNDFDIYNELSALNPYKERK